MTPETAVSSRTLSFFLLLNLESVLLCCFAMSDQSQLSSSPQQVKIYISLFIYLCVYINIHCHLSGWLSNYLSYHLIFCLSFPTGNLNIFLFVVWRHRLPIIDTKWFLICTIFNCVIFLSNLTYISLVKWCELSFV